MRIGKKPEKIKKVLIYLAVIAGLFLTACSNDDGPESANQTPNLESQVPVITSIDPEQGLYRTEVIIKGINFGSAPGKKTVAFNG